MQYSSKLVTIILICCLQSTNYIEISAYSGKGSEKLTNYEAEGKKSQLGRVPATKSPSTTLPPPSDDLVDYPDVIFLAQRAGMSEKDFNVLKEFVIECAGALKKIGSDKEQSRFAVTMFTALTQHLIQIDSCCTGGISQLRYNIQSGMMLFDEQVLRVYDKVNHTDLQPETVDVNYGLFSITEKYLEEYLYPDEKPTIVVLILNFQTPLMSFNVLNDAVSELKMLKETSVHFVTIIVDPLKNRQPGVDYDITDPNKKEGFERSNHPYKKTQTQKNSEILSEFINERKANPEVGESLIREVLHKYLGKDDPLTAGIAKLNKPRLNRTNMYKDLVLEYARSMSSLPEHGFKINSYMELAYEKIFEPITNVLTNAMTWFGSGIIEASCKDTRNIGQRRFWTPKFFTSSKYPNGADCTWKITASIGHYVSLIFDVFNTELTFDRVTIYDGHNVKRSPVLGIYSGDLTQESSLVVNSTGEKIMVLLQTDGGNNQRGFHGVWEPIVILDQIDNASIVYLVDVSGSLSEDDLEPVAEWIELATKFFVFEGKDRFDDGKKDTKEKKDENIPLTVGRILWNPPKRRYKRENQEEDERIRCDFALLTFDNNAKIVYGIDQEKTQEEFYGAVNSLNLTTKPTYLGKALDFSRLRQFMYMLGEAAFTPRKRKAKTSYSIAESGVRRVLFIFSDGHSVDNPVPAAKRLCEWNIVPVLIGLGVVNLQAMEDLARDCGLAFPITTPVPEVIAKLKELLGIIKNETTTPAPPTPETTLPIKPPTTPTTTTTTTTTAQQTYPYTGTYPTIPTTTPSRPPPDDFNYDGIAGLLLAIGIIQTIFLGTIIYYHSSLPLPNIEPNASSFSLHKIKKKQQKREEEAEQEEISPYAARKKESGSTFELGVKKSRTKRQETRYPEAVNSFFTRNTVLAEHLKVHKKNSLNDLKY